MAIGTPVLVANLYSTTNGTAYSSSSGSPSANSKLYAFFEAAAGVGVDSVSGWGLTWTLVTSQLWATSAEMFCYSATVGAAPGAGTLDLDFTSDARSGCCIVVVEVPGAIETPLEAVSASGNSSTRSVTMASLDSAHLLLFGFAHTSEGAPTFVSPLLSLDSGGHAAPNRTLGVGYEASPADTTPEVTDGATQWVAIGIEVDDAPSVADLVIQGATHAHTADSLALTQDHSLTIADASHGQASDVLALTQTHVLAVQDATHAHAADSPTLAQVHALAIQDATHSHAADNATLEAGATDLVIQDASHAHSADNLVLAQTHVLAVADATHAHSAANVTLSTPNPFKVTGLTALTISASQINLAWDTLTHDGGGFVYDIERNGSVIVENHATNSYNNTGLTASTLYEYRVRAVR